MPLFKLENIISFKLDFDNLQTFLDFLDKKTKKSFSQIQEISSRLLEFNLIQEDLKEVKIRLDTMNSRLEEMGQAQIYHSTKLMEIERTSTDFETVLYSLIIKRFVALEKENSINLIKFDQIESKFLSINKVIDDHSKGLEVKFTVYIRKCRVILALNSSRLKLINSR